MTEGRKILSKDQWKDWDEIVPIRLHDIYHGKELDSALKAIKILNNGGNIDKAKVAIDSKNHSGYSYSLTLALINKFCEKGKDLYE